jgi:hypothetical protein
MGCWALPDTHAKVQDLASLMERPMDSDEAEKEAWNLVGDDMLFDLIQEAGDTDTGADVRPLVAAFLESLVRWSLPTDFRTPWELGVREKLAFLVEPFEDTPLPRFLSLEVADNGEAAAARVDEMLGKPADGGRRDFTTRRVAPGVHAALEAATGRVFRVECRYGLVNEAPEQIRDELRETLFPTAAPRLN